MISDWSIKLMMRISPWHLGQIGGSVSCLAADHKERLGYRPKPAHVLPHHRPKPMGNADLGKRFLCPESDMQQGGIEMTLEEKEGDQHLLNQAVVRGSEDKEPAWPEQSSKFAKNEVDVINVLNDLRTEDSVKSTIGIRHCQIRRNQLELQVRKTFPIPFNDSLGDINAVNLVPF